MSKYYTGVGSRDTPPDILSLMERVAEKLSFEGWVLRSGGAAGADLAFQRGALDREQVWPERPLPLVYLPWKNFQQHIQESYPAQYVVVSYSDYKDKARELVSEVHPAWEKCSQGAKALHTRNAFQVLGDTLSEPSKFCILWAPPTKDGVKGGTNTAYQLCLRHGVPVYNLFYEDVRRRIEAYTEDG